MNQSLVSLPGPTADQRQVCLVPFRLSFERQRQVKFASGAHRPVDEEYYIYLQ